MTNPLSLSTAAAAAAGKDDASENRCQYYLPSKRRYCANSPLPNSKFCGNHDPSSKSCRVPCPIDPSHSVFVENLDSHVKRCPLKKQVEILESKLYYSKGVNGGVGGLEGENVGAEEKRRAIYAMNVNEFYEIIAKIKAFRAAMKVDLKESFVEPDACKKWMNMQVNRQVPYQEKHVVQQVSIIGNMEAFGVLKKPEKLSFSSVCAETDGLPGEEDVGPAVIEFGAGRGYLTHMLADCYEMKKIFLIERRSYKLKADRSLRQIQGINLERLRIDIEDLDLHGIESLKGYQYIAIGKHLCGSATDTNFMSKMGITPEDFHAMTRFSSWAVDGDHSSVDISDMADQIRHPTTCKSKQTDSEEKGVEEAIRSMSAAERVALGFMCKEIIDMGRLLWLRDHPHGFDAQIVEYVPANISPENHLLVAKCKISGTD